MTAKRKPPVSPYVKRRVREEAPARRVEWAGDVKAVLERPKKKRKGT